ncbi:putative L-lactate dehydrogenase [Kockovaella imperatae]|uniref:Putative L-lactate dehydrogenase n=1 Tax=Kockovaella imperatae TaxID=4999 RepID=A0A1Y1URH3_9TREE|nr:putative L-lactate dehydrogenase [Kockovaella imperatae]ORX39755.1 putative L-lactate dehydrogenase [Kockovaella imperatae]
MSLIGRAADMTWRAHCRQDIRQCTKRLSSTSSKVDARCRQGYRSYSSYSSRPSHSGHLSNRLLQVTSISVALGLAAWVTSEKVLADTGNSKPDYVHASGQKENRSKFEGQVSIRDVLDHEKGDQVWVVIKGDVYDMTEFLDDHPGGKDIILNNRSKDVTPIFNPRHPSDQLDPDNIPPNVHRVGSLDLENASDEEKASIRLKVSSDQEEENDRIKREREAMEERGLGVIVNMRDFEKYAEPMISKVAWAYYASAADDEITKNTNASAYQKVVFRPRILRKVAQADCSTEILGKASSIPVFISPAAMAKLGHPDGEVNLTKGAHSTGIIQVISSNASCSLDELCAVRSSSQPLFFQLYVNRNRDIASDLIRKLNKLNLDAIFLTGDAPVGGKRERDLRLKGEFEGPAGGVAVKGEGESKGVSEAMFAGVDPDLNWEDIKWIKSLSDMPIVVKGIQCVEDALLAYEHGASGILISNHGGRQLDTTRPSLDVLLEIRKHAPQLLRPQYRGPTGLIESALKDPQRLIPKEEVKIGKVMDKEGNRPFEIYVDGGIHRGTDVVKALCLGANAVGVGRGFLFAQSVAGVQGVEHAVGILEKEILLTLRLLGVNKLEELRPSMVEVKE